MKSYVEDLIRKYVCIAIFASIFLLTTTILFTSAYNEKYKIAYANVEKISITGPPKKGEETGIYLIGFYYCPYKLHSHEVILNVHKKEVYIELWQIRLPRLCPQVYRLYPFNYLIYVRFPLSGNWTIFCNNKISISIIVYN